MIDLQAVVRAFVGPAIEITQLNTKKNIDSRAVNALHNKNDPGRRETLKTWLGSYAVFQGFRHADRSSAVDAILDFGDTEGCHFDTLANDALVDKFHRLRGVCGKAVPPTRIGKARDLISLTSKGLWCCYPNAIPIYDSYAQQALWILCKLAELHPTASVSNDRYPSFADAWFQIYRQVEPIIGEYAAQVNYPYKVRILDRILWLIGRPGYTKNITPRMF